MRGHVRRPAGMKTWQAIYELGEQPAQRCLACNKRFWVERWPLKACPACGGELKERRERRQGCRSGFRTKKDAQIALTEVLGTLQQGTYVEPTKTTVGEFLRDEWLPAIESTVRATTMVGYRVHVEAHLVPALGTVPLQKLTPSALNHFYRKLLAEPRRSQKKDKSQAGDLKPLSATSVRHIHATLHRALRDAVRWSRILRNPADAANPPRMPRGEEMKTWSAKELRTFLNLTKGSRLHPLWRALAATGMRRGEALGLRWADVDLEGSPSLTVRQTLVSAGYVAGFSEPKTKRGRRTVSIDAETASVLKEWRKTQKAERLAWGPAWTDTGLLFTREDGSAWHPDRISKLFEAAAEAAGLPRVRLHDLRHTHATLALAAGIHPKVVSDRLGHATVAFTLDVYSHCVPALAQDAADRIAALVAAAE